MKVEFIALTLAIFSLVISIIAYTELAKAKEEVAVELMDLEKQNDLLGNEVITLKQNVSSINHKLASLQTQFNATILSQQQKIAELNQSLTEFETKLSDRINWIKSNANINYTPHYQITKTRLYKCYNGRINLGCIWFLLHDEEGIKYIRESKDELTNLTEIYEKKGGDCEDLSLLFAATVRYAMHKYGNEFVAWKHGAGNFIIYKTSNREYYLPNAEEFMLEANHIYITCYGIGKEGHCAVSFCKDEVQNIEDLYNCVLIEPQDYGMLSHINGNIWFYISANDLCMNISETKCFSDFLQDLANLRNG